jgi:hypothetical protein
MRKEKKEKREKRMEVKNICLNLISIVEALAKLVKVAETELVNATSTTLLVKKVSKKYSCHHRIYNNKKLSSLITEIEISTRLP